MAEKMSWWNWAILNFINIVIYSFSNYVAYMLLWLY